MNLTLASLLTISCGLPALAQSTGTKQPRAQLPNMPQAPSVPSVPGVNVPDVKVPAELSNPRGLITPTGVDETQKPTENQLQSLPGAQLPHSDPLTLLQQPQVHKELQLTSAQVEELKKINQEARANPVRSRSAQPRDLQTEVVSTRDRVAKVLQPEQLNRFRQILLQVSDYVPEEQNPTRPRGGNRPDPLGITPQQQEKLRGIQEQNTQNLGGVARSRSNDPQETCRNVMATREKNEAARQRSRSVGEETLTTQQKAELDRLKGDKFELSAPPCLNQANTNTNNSNP
jgi:hypothetical protein